MNISSYADKYQDIKDITPKTIPWTDFYTDSYAGQDDDAAYSYVERCGRCGGQGGSQQWVLDGGRCWECFGVNSTRTVRTKVSEMRRREVKAAQLLAQDVRRELKKARALEEKLAEAFKGYPVMVHFTWRGVETLPARSDYADNTLRDLLVKSQRWGLSAKQVELAAKLINECLEKQQRRDAEAAGWVDVAAVEAEAAKSPVPVSDDKQLVTGTVKWVKWDYSDFGGVVYSMGVEDERGFTVKATVPKKIVDSYGERYGIEHGMYGELPEAHGVSKLRGAEFSFEAVLVRSKKDTTFGYAKRLSKVKLVEVAA